MSRVEDIVHQRMASDMRLRYLGPDAAHAELMQEMDRFPLVQRAVADVPALQNPAFRAAIQKSLRRLVRTEGEEETSSEEDESDEESSEGEGDVEPSSRAPSPVNGVAEGTSNGIETNGRPAHEDAPSSDAEQEGRRLVPTSEGMSVDDAQDTKLSLDLSTTPTIQDREDISTPSNTVLAGR